MLRVAINTTQFDAIAFRSPEYGDIYLDHFSPSDPLDQSNPSEKIGEPQVLFCNVGRLSNPYLILKKVEKGTLVVRTAGATIRFDDPITEESGTYVPIIDSRPTVNIDEVHSFYSIIETHVTKKEAIFANWVRNKLWRIFGKEFLEEEYRKNNDND